MDKKDEIIAELRRVANLLQTSALTASQFSQHGRVSANTVRNHFGSWNQAVEAAGLVPTPSGPPPNRKLTSDAEYLQEIIRLTREIGKQPAESEMRAKGRFSTEPYIRRWGSFVEARRVAYQKYGFPGLSTTGAVDVSDLNLSKNSPTEIVPETHKPFQRDTNRKKVQYGEPLDFRGLRHAPINEQGVVYIFGMVSRELGFLIESIRTAYPDCEGKRYVDQKRQRLEPVLIEFEYQSSNFRLHGHNPEGCDLIVCWIHDWEDCPLEVLELSSQIKYLPNQ